MDIFTDGEDEILTEYFDVAGGLMAIRFGSVYLRHEREAVARRIPDEERAMVGTRVAWECQKQSTVDSRMEVT